MQLFLQKPLGMASNSGFYSIRSELGVNDPDSIGFGTREFTVPSPHTSVEGQLLAIKPIH